MKCIIYLFRDAGGARWNKHEGERASRERTRARRMLTEGREGCAMASKRWWKQTRSERWQKMQRTEHTESLGWCVLLVLSDLLACLCSVTQLKCEYGVFNQPGVLNPKGSSNRLLNSNQRFSIVAGNRWNPNSRHFSLQSVFIFLINSATNHESFKKNGARSAVRRSPWENHWSQSGSYDQLVDGSWFLFF